MGYSFSTEDLIRLAHKIRWDESMPDEFEGLNFNYIMEDIVDQLRVFQMIREESGFTELYRSGIEKIRANKKGMKNEVE